MNDKMKKMKTINLEIFEEKAENRLKYERLKMKTILRKIIFHFIEKKITRILFISKRS